MKTDSTVNRYWERGRKDTLDWIESARDRGAGWGRWKYNAGMLRPHSLIGTRLALSMLDQLGTLDSIGAQEKAEAVAYLQSC